MCITYGHAIIDLNWSETAMVSLGMFMSATAWFQDQVQLMLICVLMASLNYGARLNQTYESLAGKPDWKHTHSVTDKVEQIDNKYDS